MLKCEPAARGCTIQDCVQMRPDERREFHDLLARTTLAAAALKRNVAKVVEETGGVAARFERVEEGTVDLARRTTSVAAATTNVQGRIREAKQAIWNAGVSMAMFLLHHCVQPPKARDRGAGESQAAAKPLKNPNVRLVYESPSDNPQELPPPPGPDEGPITIYAFRPGGGAPGDDEGCIRPPGSDKGGKVQVRLAAETALSPLPPVDPRPPRRGPLPPLPTPRPPRRDAISPHDAQAGLAFGGLNPILELYELQPPAPPQPPPVPGFPPGTVIG